MINFQEIVNLAREIEQADPADWSDLNIDEETAYKLIASGLIEHFECIKDKDDQVKLLLATAVKLSVENFLLNLKLLKSHN